MLSRRSLIRGLAASSAAIWSDQTLDAALAFTNTASRPSELKITDLRVATIKDAPFRCPILRIDTNQGVYGLGEVRDGASKNYALMLKSRLIGENPCNVDRIFRKIKQFGFHGRQGGGVCGVEMALWDLAGKVYNVPVYQMLGGKFRDRIRCYADTTESHDPNVYGKRLRARPRPGLHLAQDGPRRRPGGRSAQRAHLPRRRGHRPIRRHAAHVHRHRDHRQRHRPDVRLRGHHARHHRLGCSAGGGSLRPHRLELLHPPGQGAHEIQPGLAWKIWFRGSTPTSGRRSPTRWTSPRSPAKTSI